ncbi:ptr-24 [Pristionchus pacificus]|nr:ptr-24 [Pristionchus pacificus]|eukprot:PDM60866.1 ptr-24 [Pristionchus pacificus]
MIQPLSFSFKLQHDGKGKGERMLFRAGLLSLGEIIGRRPLLFAIPSAVLAVTAIVAFVFAPRNVILNMEDGFSSKYAESHRANSLQVSFFAGEGASGKPWYMGLFAEPRNRSKGNILNTKEYEEFAGFYKSIKKDLTIMSNERGNFTFMDYCGEMCHLNDPLFKTMGVYNMIGWISGMKVQWPVTQVMQYNANIGKHLFHRTEDKHGELTDVDLGALYFMLFDNGTEMSQALKNFETAAYIEANRHNTDPTKKTNLIIHSAVGMEGEIKRGLGIVGNYFAVGAVFLLAFLIAAIAIESFVHSRLSLLSFGLVPCAFFLPIFASVSAFALCTVLQMPFNIMMLMTPVVAIGLTLDSVLHVYNSWLHVDRDMQYGSNEAQLGYIFLFTPLMVILVPCKSHMKINEKTSKPLEAFWNVMSLSFSVSIALRLVSLIVVAAGFAATIYGMNNGMKSNVDYRSLLPPYSASRKGAGIMTDTVWPDLLHIIFFVESPPDFGNPEEFGAFTRFLNESSSLPYAMGKDADMNWLSDFPLVTNTPANVDRFNMSLFRSFITHDLAAKYPQFDLIPFDTEVAMVDVLNELPQYAIGFPIALSVFIFALFLIFSPNLASAAVAAATSFVLSYLILGCTLLLGMELNPFTMAFLLLSISLVGRLVVHITFHYHESGLYKDTKVGETPKFSKSRVSRTLQRSTVPTLLSSLLGVILLLPLPFNPIPMFTYFGLLGSIQLGLGLLFSFLFLPLLLHSVPRALIGEGLIYTRH